MKKLASNFLYSLKQGIKGIFKNKTMSFISVISVTSALIILGIVLTMVLNINQFILVAKDQINEIRVSIDTTLDETQKDRIKDEINRVDGIKSIEYKTKEVSFNDMKDSFGEDAHLLDGIKNPLDDFYVVTIDNPENLETIANKLSEIDGTKDVKYHQDIMQNFLNISNMIKKFGSLIIICLMLICLVIISNTIKARVYSKKEEIQIIKYVGASNSFIIAPFIVEGFTIGILGSAIAVGICVGMYGYILEKITVFLNSMFGSMILPLNTISMPLIGVLLVTGISIGVLGSAISVKKYLRV